MSGISNKQIYDVLLEIKGEVSGLAATSKAHADVFAQHVKDDEKMSADILALKLIGAKQKGATRTWGFLATGAAALGGIGATLAANLFKVH